MGESADHGVERLHAVVQGRVQAVGFRLFVEDEAQSLELRGWVRNRPDGTVECVAEGSREALDRLLAALRKGPPLARVAAVEARFEEARADLPAFGVSH
ncbi:MAG: acylphosphatase [bacterium]|nr:acylphosphatase [bacterium]